MFAPRIESWQVSPGTVQPPKAPPTVETHSCGSVVGLGQDPCLLACLHGGPKPRSRGDCLFGGPGCVDFPSHPVHFQGPEPQGQVSLPGLFSASVACLSGREGVRERGGSATRGGGGQWRGRQSPKGRQGFQRSGRGHRVPQTRRPPAWAPPQESPTAPHIPTSLAVESPKPWVTHRSPSPPWAPGAPPENGSTISAPSPWHHRKEPTAVGKFQCDLHCGPLNYDDE